MPYPVPSNTTASAGPVSPCSARHAAAWAWWCCTPTSSASCSRAQRVDEVVGVQVVGDHSGSTPASRGRARGRPGRLGSAGSESRSPRWGERNASSPRATQKVLLSSAPAATRGAVAATGSGSASGAKPRERRIGKRRPHDRVLAAAVDRPVVGQERVGDAAEPLARVLVVECDRLVGAVAARHHERAAEVAESRWCSGVYGSITPSHGVPGATDGATGASARGAASTIGRAASAAARARPARARPSALRVGGHDRERLLVAVLASRSRATAASLAASQARW